MREYETVVDNDFDIITVRRRKELYEVWSRVVRRTSNYSHEIAKPTTTDGMTFIFYRFSDMVWPDYWSKFIYFRL